MLWCLVRYFIALLFGAILLKLSGQAPLQYRISLVAFCAALKKFDHITPLLKFLRWLPLRQQLYFRFSLLVFKCLTRCASEYLTSTLVRRSAVSTRNTRNSHLLNTRLFRTASGQRTFQDRATSLWNELQPALKLGASVTNVKRLLRKQLLNDCFLFNFLTFIFLSSSCT